MSASEAKSLPSQGDQSALSLVSSETSLLLTARLSMICERLRSLSTDCRQTNAAIASEISHGSSATSVMPRMMLASSFSG